MPAAASRPGATTGRGGEGPPPGVAAKGATLSASDFAFRDFAPSRLAARPDNRAIATDARAPPAGAGGGALRENRAPRAEPPSAALRRTVAQLSARLVEMERDHVLATKRSASFEAQLADRTAELARVRGELDAARAAGTFARAGADEGLGGGSEASALRAQVRELSAALARADGDARLAALSGANARPHDLQLEAKMYFKECVRLQQELAAVADERNSARRLAAELAAAREAVEVMRARERDRADGDALDALARRAVLDQIDDAATALRREVGEVARFVGLPPDDADTDPRARGSGGRAPTIDELIAEARADAQHAAARETAERLRAQQHAELAELRAALDSREADREALEARAAMLASELDKPLLLAWRAPGLDADAAAARRRRAEQRRQVAAATRIAAVFVGRRARASTAAERARRAADASAATRDRDALMQRYREGQLARARAPAPGTRAQIDARRAELARLEGTTGARVPAGVPGGVPAGAGAATGPRARASGGGGDQPSARERQRQLMGEVQALEAKTGARVLNPRPTQLDSSSVPAAVAPRARAPR